MRFPHEGFSAYMDTCNDSVNLDCRAGNLVGDARRISRRYILGEEGLI